MTRNLVITLAATLIASGAARGDDARLTPIGGERAGNADGTIPEWGGGLSPLQWPAAYTPGGRLLDPYAADVPLFVIDAHNHAQHVAQLSAGHRALFAKFPDYTLSVYPTRRSVAFPDEVYAATAANHERARLKGADAIEGARLGVPFPEPKSGIEVLWNHRLRYHGDALVWHYQRAVVHPDGPSERSRAVERVLYGYANVRRPVDLARENAHSWTLLYLKPAEIYSDCIVLWHDAVNALSRSRANWTAVPGKSWRWPPAGYDEIGMFSQRIRFADMLDMFSGAFDRYVFKLLGKREVVVPYNAFRAGDSRLADGKWLTPGHPRQDPLRYELHRVWVVEATLRSGEAHSVARRVFYVDEDSWSVLLADDYDRSGKLWRFQEGHLLPLYPAQAVDYSPVLTYDLIDGRYFADRLLADSPPPQFDAPLRKGDFTPDAATKHHEPL